MKNLSKKISFSILVLIFFFNASSQECLFNDNTGDDPPYSPADPYNSENGWYLPVNGTLRILFVYAEIEYDTGVDPDTNPNDEWNPHTLPDWADDILDPTLPSSQKMMTLYCLTSNKFGHFSVKC